MRFRRKIYPTSVKPRPLSRGESNEESQDPGNLDLGYSHKSLNLASNKRVMSHNSWCDHFKGQSQGQQGQPLLDSPSDSKWGSTKESSKFCVEIMISLQMTELWISTGFRQVTQNRNETVVLPQSSNRNKRQMLCILWYEFVTNEEVATLSQLSSIHESYQSEKTLSLWRHWAYGSGYSCPPSPILSVMSRQGSRQFGTWRRQPGRPRNAGWSRSPRAQSSLILMLGVLWRIGQHGGRNDPSTVKRTERRREITHPAHSYDECICCTSLEHRESLTFCDWTAPSQQRSQYVCGRRSGLSLHLCCLAMLACISLH